MKKEKHLHGWEFNSIKGTFVLYQQTEEIALMVKMFQFDDGYYGVKGLSTAISTTLNESMPVMVDTVLLPFGNRIIYDGFLFKFPFNFKAKSQKRLKRPFKKAIKREGIITDLTEY